MNDIVTSQGVQLPDTIEDLSKFVLVNEERVQALRAQIRAIKKVSIAKDVYEQKLAEAQEVSEMTLLAAQKMGELLLQIQKQQGQRTDLTSSTHHEEVKSKSEIASNMGMTKDQVSQYQQMAQYPEAVEAAIEKAREEGKLASRAQVMNEIKQLKSQLAQTQDELKKAKEISLHNPVKEVEVVPDDYEQIKRDLADSRKRERLVSNERQRYLDELHAARQRLSELESRGDQQQKLEQEAAFFTAYVNEFVQKIGGYVWVADSADKLPERQRNEFIKAVINIDGWAQAMMKNLGGNLK